MQLHVIAVYRVRIESMEKVQYTRGRGPPLATLLHPTHLVGRPSWRGFRDA